MTESNDKSKKAKSNYNISKETVFASMTALRHFNRELNEELDSYLHQSGCYSIVVSIEQFIKVVEKAYAELQSKTKIKTPLEIKES